MRVFEQQELVWSLLPALGFGAEDTHRSFPVAGKNLRLLLRGESMPLTTTEPTKRYLVTDDERNQQAVALIVKVIETVLGTTKNAAVLKEHLGGRKPTSRKDWDTVKPYLTWEGLLRPGLPRESLPLWNVGFWNLLSELRSSEAYQYISDAFGYYSLSTNWNAAEAMQEVFLGVTEKPEYKTLREGMGALPQALAKQVTALGGQIVLNTRLASFEAPTKAEAVTAETGQRRRPFSSPGQGARAGPAAALAAAADADPELRSAGQRVAAATVRQRDPDAGVQAVPVLRRTLVGRTRDHEGPLDL